VSANHVKGLRKHAFMVTEGRAYPPIEGGQSLAEAEPSHKRGPIFLAAVWKLSGKKMVDFYSRKSIMFPGGYHVIKSASPSVELRCAR
jgi:hypothetical protein